MIIRVAHSPLFVINSFCTLFGFLVDLGWKFFSGFRLENNVDPSSIKGATPYKIKMLHSRKERSLKLRLKNPDSMQKESAETDNLGLRKTSNTR